MESIVLPFKENKFEGCVTFYVFFNMTNLIIEMETNICTTQKNLVQVEAYKRASKRPKNT
jgi:hypothetical protein